MEKNIWKITIFSRFVILIILPLALSGCAAKSVSGKIAFFWKPEDNTAKTMKLILADGLGNDLRFVGYFTGSPAFSRDGSQIAVGCEPSSEDNIVTSICILNIDQFNKSRSQIPVGIYDTRSVITRTIQLPKECQIVSQDPDILVNGIISLDWSPKSDRLLVVCGTLNIQNVCIVPLEGDSTCWDKEASEGVFRALWSPTDENKIITSGWQFPSSDIYLVNQNGKKIKKIASGLNAAWSRDGKKIAYIENIQDPIKYGRSQGIAIIDSDGSNHKWVYYPNLTPGNINILMDGFNSVRLERLAWSPDDKSIIFSGTYGDIENHGLFKLDVLSGKVTYFLDPGIFSSIVVEPDWAP
jgi:hypothetical protein